LLIYFKERDLKDHESKLKSASQIYCSILQSINIFEVVLKMNVWADRHDLFIIRSLH